MNSPKQARMKAHRVNVREYKTSTISIASPLTTLTCKSTHNQALWSNQRNYAFLWWKKVLCQSPILHGPDFEQPLILQTYASDQGIGVVLSLYIIMMARNTRLRIFMVERFRRRNKDIP